MNWSTIRLIWFREVRDLFRDRRTVFIITILPIILYPLLGLIGYHLTLGLAETPSMIGIDGMEHLPQPGPAGGGVGPANAVAWFSAAPVGPVSAGPAEGIAGAAALSRAARPPIDFPPLLVDGKFPRAYFDSASAARVLRAKPIQPGDLMPLVTKEVDLVLVVPPDFRQRLEEGGRPEMRVVTRDDHDGVNLADRRLNSALSKWKKGLREVRLQRHGLPPDFDDPFVLTDPQRDRPVEQRASDELAKLLARLFPFLIVTWSLAGALYPAIDLCAGEKERGTMETLLITPTTREEIVLGKFLAIWVFSGLTALWNLAILGGSGLLLRSLLPYEIIRPWGMAWCVILVVPLSGLFSAISLALGAYARSTKEGQYYLMPLFLVTMPLVFITMIPGVELNLFYSLVPVTGTALLLHRLMTAPSMEDTWVYFIPVLSSLILLGWVSLRWAVQQFQREEVLFHEADKLEIGLWLKRLFVDEE